MIGISKISFFSDGIEFFVSDNGVILSEGIDGTLQPKYFKKVVHRIDGQGKLVLVKFLSYTMAIAFYGDNRDILPGMNVRLTFTL